MTAWWMTTTRVRNVRVRSSAKLRALAIGSVKSPADATEVETDVMRIPAADRRRCCRRQPDSARPSSASISSAAGELGQDHHGVRHGTRSLRPPGYTKANRTIDGGLTSVRALSCDLLDLDLLRIERQVTGDFSHCRERRFIRPD